MRESTNSLTDKQITITQHFRGGSMSKLNAYAGPKKLQLADGHNSMSVFRGKTPQSQIRTRKNQSLYAKETNTFAQGGKVQFLNI